MECSEKLNLLEMEMFCNTINVKTLLPFLEHSLNHYFELDLFNESVGPVH